MQAISTRDVLWAVVLFGGGAVVLGRYLVRAVRRGRCAGCGVAECPSRASKGATASCQPPHFARGAGPPRPTGKGTPPVRKGEQRAERRRGPTARQFHGGVAAVAFPLLLILLLSSIGLLFRDALALDRRPLPAWLALPLYGDVAGAVVATARGAAGEAMATAEGVIVRTGQGPWRGVVATGLLGTVHDLAWLGDGHLAAATDRGVWISAGGERWDYLADGGAGLPPPATRLLQSDGALWVRSVLGPRRSTDGGVSWLPATGVEPAGLAGPPMVADLLPAGAERAWLRARGWPTWERFTIDLHGGHLFGGRWRWGVLFSWLLLAGLAISGPLVARARRRHLQERAVRQAAPVVATPAVTPAGDAPRLDRAAANTAP
ncbi:MAG: hypothetical protein GW783_03715 [Deltaproteobacteria bacterium]|nr:hypothetical protein [Deltaproteobacteria bacterium]NCP95775.1 hypothetical protein [Deltaproteobacteria bacterium]NCS73227.1 hypothetical protein [Deltaproteobacteria bacterium]OIP64265.1 MAG: hypothetical protein AUK30_07055 [Nitrospirae bacterium CG2_30_70_394]PIU80222.1 MAG: hypothetical protein COS73_00470 [Nitrospirae bacterium CG06_land_8_20_14_3_00_70_43]